MPSLIPQLFDFALLSPFILRVAVGVVLITQHFGELKSAKNNSSSLSSSPVSSLASVGFLSVLNVMILIGAIMLITGIYTQGVALTLILITSVKFTKTYKAQPHIAKKSSVGLMVLILTILLSLVISGAGFFAYDLPL